MRYMGRLMALFPLAWFLLGSGPAAGMCVPSHMPYRMCPEMPNASQPRCFAGAVGGEICVIEIYTVPQSDLDANEPELDYRKLTFNLRGLDDDDDPEPFPIPAPGVGRFTYILTIGGYR